MPFLKGGRHLWTHFSQLFSDKNEEFLCPSERKFPELFKTHPTFVYSPLLVPSMACQTQRGVFFETPCISHPLQTPQSTFDSQPHNLPDDIHSIFFAVQTHLWHMAYEFSSLNLGTTTVEAQALSC